MKNIYYTNFNGDLYETIVAGEKISVYKKGYATFTGGNPQTTFTYYFQKKEVS